jgi:DNA/RNA-binding domain of Phe-tRNA-synthetase-like protein
VISLSIASEFKARLPAVAVGCLCATVKNSEHDDQLWQEIEVAVQRYAGLTMEEGRKRPPIRALRDAYRALGNDPTRYRGSNEALLRRIVQGKGLYHVNTIVDVNNLVSLENLLSAGTFDLELVHPPVVFRAGQAGESYAGIGRGEINLECLPVFADQIGPFASTTSDSERAMIRLETTRIQMVVISFLGSDGMDAVLHRAAGLFERYAAASGIAAGVVA